ncbi:MAG TPA: hypothetical protein DDZ68_07255 [Parvularcula sp.]|nr:hypothetical protein [Parvularcula sp.]HBS32935.1 hypothetical protein [Parvularcula sp.]
MKVWLFAAASLSLAACASASKPGAMVAQLTDATIIREDSSIRSAFTVGTVTGGKETSPLWKSNVSSDDFAEALRQSLAGHALLASSDGKYVVDAELVQVKQPVLGGFNMTVTSTVKYKVTEAATSTVVLDEEVVNEYTAKMGDAFVGVERLRLANEGSMKGNIGQFIEALVTKMDAAAVPMIDSAVEEAAPQS